MTVDESINRLACWKRPLVKEEKWSKEDENLYQFLKKIMYLLEELKFKAYEVESG